MSATIVVSINGTTLASHSIFVHGTPEDWASAPRSSRAAIGTGGRVRSWLSRTDDVAARQFDIPFRLATYTLANRLTESDWIKAFHRQQITLKVDDGSWTRELIGTVIAVRLVPVTRWDTPVMDGMFSILAGDPLWRDTSDTVTGSITTGTTLALGTAPTEDWSMAITVSGGSDSRTITATIGGTTSYVMTDTGSFAGKTLHLYANTASALNDAANAIAGHVGGFPALDPANGTVTLTMTCSSGTATAVVTYRKKYY